MASLAFSYEPSALDRANRTLDPERMSKVKPEAIARQVQADQADKTPNLPAEQIEKDSRVFHAVPEFRRMPANAEQVFATSKEWEGYIQALGNSHFIAELHGVSSKDSDRVEIAEIPISDIPRADRHLLREGAIFRYLVGYAKDKNGTVTRKRHVYFRRGKVSTKVDKETEWLAIADIFRI